jgi:integrase
MSGFGQEEQVTGSIQHLGGDRYRVRIYAGLDPVTSRERYRSKTFQADGQRAADLASTAVITALRNDIKMAAEQKGTVAELAKDWLELKRRQGRAPATLQGYETIADRIVKRFGARQVADITGRDIDRWYGDLIDTVDKKTKRRMTASTVQHHHAVLRAMLRQAERWDIVPTVATRRSSPPSVERREISPPTDAALAVLIAGAGTGDFANAVRVLAGTGIRRGELCGLAWSDLVGDQLTVRRSVFEPKGGGMITKVPKGRKPRTMTIGADVLAAFEAQRRNLEAKAAAIERTLPKDGPIFADLDADPSGQKPRRPWWVSNEWIQLRNKHGVTFRLHDLRHWNATMLLNGGVPAVTVAQRLGHAQVSTTNDIYGHSIAGSDRSAAELLSGVLGVATTVTQQ